MLDFLRVDTGLNGPFCTDQANLLTWEPVCHQVYHGVNHIDYLGFFSYVFRQEFIGGGARRIAGDNDDFASLLEKDIGNFYRISLNGGFLFIAIGKVGRIAKVDDAFVG